MKVINAWASGSTINLLYRDDFGKKKIKHISDFKWYFVINEIDLKRTEVSAIIDLAISKNVVSEIEICSPYAKIYCIADKWNNSVKWLVNKLKTLGVCVKESDLNLTKRYMIDNHIELEDNLKYCFFDIETDDTNPGIEIGRDQILSWAISDKEGNSFFEKLKKRHNKECEKELIKNMVKKFLDYDLVVSWNGAQFDLPYIESRIEKLNIATKNNILLTKSIFWKNFIHIDAMQQVIRLFGSNMSTIGLSGFSLNEVANFFIGEEKVKHTESIINLFKYNPEKFEKYNRKDADLLQKLDAKLGIVPLMIKECCWTGCFLNRFYVSELLDNYILREAHKQNVYMKSRPDWDNNENEDVSIKGGFVMTPKPGLYDNMRVFDQRSLYPSIIVTFNVGAESLVEELSKQGILNFNNWLGERKLEDVDFIEWYEFLRKENKTLNPKNKYIQTANNQYFRRNIKSIIAGLLGKLLEERKTYKKLQKESKTNSPEYKNYKASQETIKILANSLYGIVADKRTRYFDPRIAEAITMTGQYIIRTNAAIALKKGIDTKYSDTDSMFLVIEKDDETLKMVDYLNEKLITYLNKTYKFTENIIFLQYEKKFRKFAMIEKKRYAGHLVYLDGKETDQILIKGLETVRKTTIEFARRSIHECLDLILKQDKDEKFIFDWVKNLQNEVLTKNIPVEDLTITTKVSKPIADYKTKGPHVRLAEKLIQENRLLETKSGLKVWGTKIEYVIIDGSSKTESILAEDFDGRWDRKYYWDVQIFSPIYRILTAIFPEINWKVFMLKEQEKIERLRIREEKKKEKERIKTEKAIEKEKKKLKKEQLTLI
jgi:DNA polymerase I